MNYNTFLVRFGFNPNNFENILVEPIQSDDGFVYQAYERKSDYYCPNCGLYKTHVHQYSNLKVKISINNNEKEYLLIRRIRYKCPSCGKTFVRNIDGLKSHYQLSTKTINLIRKDFYSKLTFKEIADKYDLSMMRVIQLFDETFVNFEKPILPKVLCIDEFYFSRNEYQRYVCCLTDYESGQIVDLISSRLMPFLNQYFSNFTQKELKNTQYFISDMYDGYKRIKEKFFPDATYLIDIFHVVIQLTRVLNQIRVNTMNKFTIKNSIEYNFMKKNWKLFLCRKEKIPNKTYTHKNTKRTIHFDILIGRCLDLNPVFEEGYRILQDLFHYYWRKTFNQALDFIDYISSRLANTGNKLFIDVANTYKKWRIPIANAFYINANSIKYTNAIAESRNNDLKTILKSAYGYRNFERFRKRALLIYKFSQTKTK